MKTYKLNNSSKLFSFDHIHLLGNLHSGALIRLNEEGLSMINKIKEDSSIDYTKLSELEEQFINVLTKYKFISENKIQNYSCKLNTAYFHITDRCNLKCRGCYSYIENRNSKSDVSLQNAKIIIDNLKRNGINNLIISGGEPFLHKDIIEILEYAKVKAGIKNISCITNGTADIDKYISASKFVNDISFSIDGYNSESCCIRDKHIFNIIDNKIDKLKDSTSISLIFTVHRKNIDKHQNFKYYARKKGVNYNFSILTVNIDNIDGLEDLYFREEDYDKLVSIITDYEINDSSLKQQLSCRQSCGAGKSTVSILSNGSIMPCHMFFDKRFCLGNALYDEINDVLNHTYNVFKNLSVDNIEECSNCKYKYLCGGGCRFRAYAYTNSIFGKDVLCASYNKNLNNILTALENKYIKVT